MAMVECAVCHKKESSGEMKYCSHCVLWVHYKCAGGGAWADAKCPGCHKKLG